MSHIYCLNRGADGAQRQSAGQKSRGLGQLDPSKITNLTANLAQPYLGLKLEDYNRLTEQITDVVHVAWKVDFNLALDSFLEHIVGVQRLLEFCSNTRFGAHLFFVSSISAVGSLAGNVAEKIYEEWRAPMPTGYGQSKLLAERMIDTISIRVGIPATICRVGQIAGPTSVAGMWPKQEWLPSLLATSKELGVLPESLGNNNGLDWIPVDIVGQMISDTVAKTTRQQDGRTRVLHVSSPTTVDWSDLIYTISAQLKPEMKIVTLQTWVNKLHECLTRGDNAAQVPAVKLYDFFLGLLDSGHTATHLEVGGQLKPWEDLLSSKDVQRSWMKNWIRQWGY
jgi:thioester reductase-like protein